MCVAEKNTGSKSSSQALLAKRLLRWWFVPCDPLSLRIVRHFWPLCGCGSRRRRFVCALGRFKKHGYNLI